MNRRTSCLRRPRVLCLFSILVCVAPAWKIRADGEEIPFYRLPENPVTGGRIFMEKGCAQCHAIQGLGGTAGPDLGKVQAAWSFLDIAGVMWNHTPKMEAEFDRQKIVRPTFSSDEMFQLIAFVYFLNHFSEPGDANQGELLFSKKRCISCHSIGKHGPDGKSPLDRFQIYRSPAFLGAALWNANKTMTRDMEEQGIPRPEYERNDILDLLAFIRRDARPLQEAYPVYLPPGSPKQGSIAFQEKGCAQCHAVRGRGERRGPDLGSPEFRGVLSSMEGAMLNHAPEMWTSMEQESIDYPQFSAEEISDLMTYLYFSSLVDPPGDPETGQTLFEEKGCISCHGLSPYEDTMARSASEMEMRSASDVIAAMWNHASEMKEAAEHIKVAWPQFKAGEMRDLVAFIESRSQKRSPGEPSQ